MSSNLNDVSGMCEITAQKLLVTNRIDTSFLDPEKKKLVFNEIINSHFSYLAPENLTT